MPAWLCCVPARVDRTEQTDERCRTKWSDRQRNSVARTYVFAFHVASGLAPGLIHAHKLVEPGPWLYILRNGLRSRTVFRMRQLSGSLLDQQGPPCPCPGPLLRADHRFPRLRPARWTVTKTRLPLLLPATLCFFFFLQLHSRDAEQRR